MGSSLSRTLLPPPKGYRIENHAVRAELYKWSSQEFHDEYALIYRKRVISSSTCTFHFSVNNEKVLFTFHDWLCVDSSVRVNIELVAARDSNNGHYKFGTVKAQEFGESFTERRRRSVGAELLFLRYADRVIGRRQNQFGVYRRNSEEYEIQFFTGNSPDAVLSNSLHIYCDPLKGLEVNLLGPYCLDCTTGAMELCYTDYVSGMPPQNVIEDSNVIRSELMKDGSIVSHGGNQGLISVGISSPTSSLQNNVILNSGQSQGPLNGSNIRGCYIYIQGGGGIQ